MKTFDKKYKTLLYCFAVFGIAVPFIVFLPSVILSLFLGSYIIYGFPILILAVYFLFHKLVKPTKVDYKYGMYVNAAPLMGLAVFTTLFMFIVNGDIDSLLTGIGVFDADLFLVYYAEIFSIYIFGFIFCAIASKSFKFKRIIIPVFCIVLCISSCTYMYLNRPEVKYAGHGFDYMNGYSSTDFTDYTVYAENSKLVTLSHEPSFTVENEEDMPVLDGAEACYPLYAAFAKAVYKDIDKIENKYRNDENYNNGKIVSFTNTIYGFNRLVETDNEYVDKIDMFFGARPSQDQLDYAKECGVEVEITPIGKEAFVFFVEEDNPIDNITSEQLRQIYHGDIKNWKELGGEDEEIVAFQRPENSGSQTMMKYFMKDVSLKEPKQYETVDAMEGVISVVAQYNNEDGAIGYTFRYFLEGLNQEKGVKMLSVDGIYPSVESIEDGSYPITVPLCLVTRKGDNNPNVKKMRDFILSEDGQYIIHETGYGRLANH